MILSDNNDCSKQIIDKIDFRTIDKIDSISLSSSKNGIYNIKDLFKSTMRWYKILKNQMIKKDIYA